MEELERDLTALRNAMAELKAWADSQKGSDHLSFLSGPLYHYTDVAGLKGILETKELWLTSALHLNDPDLPWKFHPAVSRALGEVTPCGAV